jgi:hypothetical protein
MEDIIMKKFKFFSNSVFKTDVLFDRVGEFCEGKKEVKVTPVFNGNMVGALVEYVEAKVVEEKPVEKKEKKSKK